MSAATRSAGSAPRSVRIAVWLIMLFGGGTSVAYNIYHAVHWGSMNIWFALLYGLVPVGIALCQSHVVAEYRDAGWVIKGITFALMIASMAISVTSTAAVVRPVAGEVMCWVFPGLLDAGALAALYIILNFRSREAAEASEIERARTAVAETAARAVAADADAAAARAELVAERAAAAERLTAEQDRAASIAAQLAAALGEVNGLRDASDRASQAAAETAEVRGQLGDVQADLASARAELQAVRDAERERRRRGTKSGTRSGTKRRSTAGTGGGTKGGTGSGTDDLSIEFRAMEVLTKEPGLNGTELAERLGVSESYGRRLRRQLASRDGEPAES